MHVRLWSHQRSQIPSSMHFFVMMPCLLTLAPFPGLPSCLLATGFSLTHPSSPSSTATFCDRLFLTSHSQLETSSSVSLVPPQLYSHCSRNPLKVGATFFLSVSPLLCTVLLRLLICSKTHQGKYHHRILLTAETGTVYMSLTPAASRAWHGVESS